MGLLDHIRKSMNPNSVAVEEATKKITVAAPISLDERLKASIAEAVDPKTKKKQAPVAPDLKPPVQKPDPAAGKPPPLQTVADPDVCKQEKYAAKGADQEEVKLGGKTPVDLNPSTDPVSPKDLEDPALKKGPDKKKVNETFKDAMKLAGKGTARAIGRGLAHGAGLPPKKTVHGVEKFVSAWRKPGAAAAAAASTTTPATVASTRSQGSTRRTASSQRQRASGAAGNAARYRSQRSGATTAATVGSARPSSNAARYRAGSSSTAKTGAVRTGTTSAPARARSSLSSGPATTTGSSSGKYATHMKGVIAASKAKRTDAASKRASSVLGKSSKATVAKAPAAKDMSTKKTSTAMASGAKRERTSLSGSAHSSEPEKVDRKDFSKALKASGGNLRKTVLGSSAPKSDSGHTGEPTKMDRKDFAKQLKASGNNLKKVRTSLSDEFVMEGKNRFNQPAPLSSHSADDHFEKMIDHHDHGLDAKDRGDKSAARVHFNTRDHHFAHFVTKATEHELHKRKLNMHKVRAMLDIKEEADPLNKVMSIYRRLRAL